MNLFQSLRTLFGGRVNGQPSHISRSRAAANFRPWLEGLEDRTVPSAAPMLAVPNLGPAQIAPAVHQITSIIPISITNVVVQNGQLVAQGLVGGTAFTAPLTLTTTPNPGGDCPILHLQINEIHLDLLGLTVDTSKICLSIDAEPGPGNLLGNLLCDVSHLLDGGTPLGTILGGLSTNQLGTLTSGVTGLLNNVFSQLTAPSAVTGATGNILHLSLGPVNLNLLGLDVTLDNCANGPITLDIGAQPGAGNLLGNLLSGLSHLLDNTHAASPALLNKLFKIANAIDRLL
jgi:hypothetical protein